MKRLKEFYIEEVLPKMKKEFGYTNTLEAPKLNKVVINIGAGKVLKDPHFFETMEETLKKITGQKPVYSRARKSISNFKIREGMKIGLMVTLRGQRMYDFVDKLIHFALPRVRDFQGIKESSFDKNGNLNIGFKEHIVFPEIESDEVDRLHGLEIAVCVACKSKAEGMAFLKLLGFPIVK